MLLEEVALELVGGPAHPARSGPGVARSAEPASGSRTPSDAEHPRGDDGDHRDHERRPHDPVEDLRGQEDAEHDERDRGEQVDAHLDAPGAADLVLGDAHGGDRSGHIGRYRGKVRTIAEQRTSAVFQVEGIEEWQGQDVLDREGDRIGKLESLFSDTEDGSPSLGCIKSGRLTKHFSLVPLAGASFGRNHVRLPFSKDQVDSAPQVGEEGPDHPRRRAAGRPPLRRPGPRARQRGRRRALRAGRRRRGTSGQAQAALDRAASSRPRPSASRPKPSPATRTRRTPASRRTRPRPSGAGCSRRRPPSDRRRRADGRRLGSVRPLEAAAAGQLVGLVGDGAGRVVIQKALAADHDVTLAETNRRGHATRLAQSAAADGTDVVVVLGGDGTLNEAAQRPRRRAVRARARCPGGSTNVFARTIGLPNDPIEATSVLLDALADGSIRRVGPRRGQRPVLPVPRGRRVRRGGGRAGGAARHAEALPRPPAVRVLGGVDVVPPLRARPAAVPGAPRRPRPANRSAARSRSCSTRTRTRTSATARSTPRPRPPSTVAWWCWRCGA